MELLTMLILYFICNKMLILYFIYNTIYVK